MRKYDLALIDEVNKPVAVQSPTMGTQQQLSSALLHILQEVQQELGYFAGDDEAEPTTQDVVNTLNKVSTSLGFELSSYERDQILSFVETDKKPFGVLQPLVEDKRISDIIVSDYSHVAVQQGRKNLNTDITFPSQNAYIAFVERLLKKSGASISTKKPIADGMIGSFARIHAVHSSLCETGPYLTIRLNRFSDVVCDDLINNGTAPQEIFDYLTALVKGGHTILVVGEVATGKTTLTRALAASIPHDETILVIEDTPEIKLSHPHVRYLRTREANTDGAGRVSPSECIRAGMRMAMNRIIFGEMRDAEAAEAFIDVCASGHPGLSTIHAKSSHEAITRLELFLGRAQKGVADEVLARQISTAVQAIVYVNICPVTGKRRIIEVKELGAVADGALRQKDMFKYEYLAGRPSWKVLCRASNYRDALENSDNPVILSKFPAVLTAAL